MPLESIFTVNPKNFKNKEKFMIFKIFQIIFLTLAVILLYYYQNYILYTNDFLGKVADVYKFIITIVSIIIIIMEPLINFENYRNMEKIKKLFYKNLCDFSKDSNCKVKIERKIKREFNQIALFFCFFFALSELGYFYISMRTLQSRNIYFIFLTTTIVLYIKVAYIIIELISYKYFLKEVNEIAISLSENFECSDKLKSFIYDRIVLERFLLTIRIYKNIHEMIEVFNKSSITLLTFFLCIKFYLMGDFYWIALITMHQQIKMIASYGKIYNSYI